MWPSAYWSPRYFARRYWERPAGIVPDQPGMAAMEILGPQVELKFSGGDAPLSIGLIGTAELTVIE